MDLFSTHKLSVDELARIMTLGESEIHRVWRERHRSSATPPLYQPVHAQITELHSRNITIDDADATVEDWRLRAEALAAGPSRDRLANQARALREYLDYNGRHQLSLLPRTTLEQVRNSMRVVARPPMHALVGGDRRWIWLACAKELDADRTELKATLTAMLAEAMGFALSYGDVEVIHSATRRTIPSLRPGTSLKNFVDATCEHVQRLWTRLDLDERRANARSRE